MKRPASLLARSGDSRGVALIVTLMMMTVLVMMVVGLAGVMRNEQAAARNLTYQVLADQLAEIGARQAMAAVASNSNATATGPGWLLSNTTLVPLFLNRSDAGFVNLEKYVTSSMILSVPNNTAGPIPGNLSAGWSNVSGGGTNPVFGRFSWWTDDEGGKLNLNYTGPANRRILPWCSPFPFSLKYVFLDPATATNIGDRSSYLEGRSNWFFTTESLKDSNATGIRGTMEIGPTPYACLKGHVTAWATHVNLNPYGQLKFPLTNLMNASQITNDTSFNSLLDQTFANPNLKGSNLISFSQNFVEKYGNGNPDLGRKILRQSMANLYEAVQPTNSTFPPISDVTGTNLPTNFLALSPRSILLNEVGVGASVNINSTGNTLQIQVWVVPELVTAGKTDLLFENTRTLFTVKSNGIRVVSAKAGGKSISGFGGFYNTTIVTNAPARRAGTITNTGFFTNRTWACFEYTWGPGRGSGPNDLLNNAGSTTELQLAVDIPEIVVQQRFGASFAVADWYLSGGTVTFSYPGDMVVNPNGSVPSPSFPGSQTSSPDLAAGLQFQGRSKSDPRCRAFSGWSNGVNWSEILWLSPTASLGLLNSGFPNTGVGLPGGLKPDRLKDQPPVATFSNDSKAWFAGTNLLWPIADTNIPVPPWSLRGTNVSGVGLLGFIHTGLPWRTFRLSAQQGDPDPPDWMLVDLFCAGSPTNAVPALNLNTQYQAVTNPAVTTRLPMVLNLLANLTNPTTDFTPPLPLSTNVWSASRLDSSSLAFQSLRSSNADRWVTGSWWDSKRKGMQSNPAIFVLGGELAEMKGIGDLGTTDEENEAALVAAGDLITPRSDTFSVWSVGQGLRVVTNSAGEPVRTNIMAEIRKQTVFQRVPQFNNSNLTGYQVRLLYTRNHVVE